MSMDIEVWSSEPFDLPAALPELAHWTQTGFGHEFEGEGWLVHVSQEKEQPWKMVKKKLRGASHVACITLEPIGASEDGYAFLEKVVRTLARKCDGVWAVPEEQVHGPDEGEF